jgi:hypothetical protein
MDVDCYETKKALKGNFVCVHVFGTMFSVLFFVCGMPRYGVLALCVIINVIILVSYMKIRNREYWV